MENSRAKILTTLQRLKWPEPDQPTIGFPKTDEDVVNRFVDVFSRIGGKAFIVNDAMEVHDILKKNFVNRGRMVSPLKTFADIAEDTKTINRLEDLHDVNIFITEATLAVAENGAVWLTEEQMGARILPFICQHLAVVVNRKMIVGTMHEAYEIIGDHDYDFATFIAGPSKTADIEQSLVMGAHGAVSMQVFIVNEM